MILDTRSQDLKVKDADFFFVVLQRKLIRILFILYTSKTYCFKFALVRAFHDRKISSMISYDAKY